MEQQERDRYGFYEKVMDKAKKENPKLIQQVVKNAAMISDSMELEDDDKKKLQAYIVCSCLAVYHSISSQLEVNELHNLLEEDLEDK